MVITLPGIFTIIVFEISKNDKFWLDNRHFENVVKHSVSSISHFVVSAAVNTRFWPISMNQLQVLANQRE